MNWDKTPNLKEFAEQFARYLDDVGCMDKQKIDFYFIIEYNS